MNIAKTLEMEKTTTVDCEWKGETFTIEVKTNVVTPKFMQRVADMRERPVEITDALAESLGGWSVDMDGAEFPPVPANLAILPVDFLTYLLGRVMDTSGGDAKAEVAAA